MSNLAADDDLPLDICHEILLRLPTESLFRFRAVCKRWRTVIDDPSFARAHTSVSSSSNTLAIKNSLGPPFDSLCTFDLDAAVNLFDGDQEISGSSLDLTHNESSSLLRRLPVSACNGLILVHPKTPLQIRKFEIWNPSTHERLQLPRLETNYPGPVYFGLGYDQSAQDFKVVAICYQKTHVYSLRSDTWRTIGDCPCVDDLRTEEYAGVFLRGALHWLLIDYKIIALDLGTEKHRHIQLNALQKKTLKHSKNLDVLGGSLAVSGFSDASQFDVWVMKDYGSDDELWIKLFSTNRVDPISDIHECLRPVAHMKDKNQVFLKDNWSGFFLYDIESDSMKRVLIHGLAGRFYAQIIPRTIFRLRDHCGGSGTSRIKPLFRPRKIKVSLTTVDSLLCL